MISFRRGAVTRPNPGDSTFNICNWERYTQSSEQNRRENERWECVRIHCYIMAECIVPYIQLDVIVMF